MKAKKEYSKWTKEEIDNYRHKFIISTMRRASYRWPWRNEAIKKARKGYGIYECARCHKEVRSKDKQLDHKRPVVNPRRGFTGWNDYTRRLLPGTSGWALLCRDCHTAKTEREREIRRRNKARRGKAKDGADKSDCPFCAREGAAVWR